MVPSKAARRCPARPAPRARADGPLAQRYCDPVVDHAINVTLPDLHSGRGCCTSPPVAVSIRTRTPGAKPPATGSAGAVSWRWSAMLAPPRAGTDLQR
jgi:hypothetical protein